MAITESIVHPAVTEDKKQARRWWTLMVLSLSLVVIGMDNTILNVAIPTLQREFNATASTLQWMIDSYILVFAGLLLTMGGLGDRFGRAKLLRLGLIIFAAAAIGASFSETSTHVVIARAVMGVGGAMIMPATLSIIIDVFRGPERARAISIWAATAGVGIGLGPLIGGALLEWFDWSSVFLVNVPIAALALVAGIWLVPDSRDDRPRPIDYLGAALSTGAVAILIYAIIEAPGEGWGSPLVMGMFAVAAVLAGLFAWREIATPYPLLDFTFFRRPRFSMGAGAISMAFFALMGMIFGFTQYMQFVKGYSALETGIRLLPLAAGVAMGARLGEVANRFFGTKVVVATALVLLAVTLTAFNLFSPETSYWAIAVGIFFTSMSMGSIMAPSTDALMNSVPERHAGVGSAMNDVTRMVGGAFGVAIIGSVLNTVYASRVAYAVDAIPGIPAQAAAASKDSVGAAAHVAGQLPAGAAQTLMSAANQAFTDAFGIAVLTGAGIAVVAAALVLRFMPSKPQPLPEEGDEETVASE